ncbi:MAG: hypothetical protein NZ908_00685 [Candidatus Micrarchaeota archaeon]|nr:hypothetical protein [Candidatus Micrarchaeota archaeon]
MHSKIHQFSAEEHKHTGDIHTELEIRGTQNRQALFIPLASALLSTFGILIYEHNLLNIHNKEILLKTSALIALYGMTYLKPRSK